MMKTIRDVIAASCGYLKERGVPESRLRAEEVIAAALGMKRMDLYLQFDKPLESDEIERCRLFLKRRGLREPLQYIEGSVDFAGVRLKIDRSVLIPRQETEIMTYLITDCLRSLDLKNRVLWDVCCGSGCIGLALKRLFPDLRVVLADTSQKALELVRRNTAANDLRVKIVQGDLLDPFRGKRCDFFVCNPPYVSEDDYEALDPEVRDFEPREALLSKEGGFFFYRRLATLLPDFLFPGGRVWLEFGAGQGDELLRLFSAPLWVKRLLLKDYAGKKRFFSLEIE